VTVPMSRSDGGDRLPTWAEMLAFAAHAEALGLDSVWVCDHFLSGPPGHPPEGIHERWTILSALAAATNRIEVGLLVMCVSFRNPALLAKMAATADAVAGGRLILGLGAGWYNPPYEAFGYPSDHRVARFEEALSIIRPLLHGESVTLAGRFHEVCDAALLARPSRPIPLLVAAKGERMLRPRTSTVGSAFTRRLGTAHQKNGSGLGITEIPLPPLTTQRK
jgi:alkanesulfonate monooxygenase SsuD/methylene tetrahydromethanopterin reductase-like flavin-dependent oxidoreductase (luciferase family)